MQLSHFEASVATTAVHLPNNSRLEKWTATRDLDRKSSCHHYVQSLVVEKILATPPSQKEQQDE